MNKETRKTHTNWGKHEYVENQGNEEPPNEAGTKHTHMKLVNAFLLTS